MSVNKVSFICTVKALEKFIKPDDTCLSLTAGSYYVVTKQTDPSWWCARAIEDGQVTDKIGLIPRDNVEIVGDGLILPGKSSGGTAPVKKKKKKKKKSVAAAGGDKVEKTAPEEQQQTEPALQTVVKGREQELEEDLAKKTKELKDLRKKLNALSEEKEDEISHLQQKLRRAQKINNKLRGKMESMSTCVNCGMNVRGNKGSKELADSAEGEDDGVELLVKEFGNRQVILKFKKFIRSVVMRRRFRKVALDFKNNKASLVMRLRNESLREIYSSEKKYVEALQLCMEEYYHPMLRMSQQQRVGVRPMVGRAEVKDIFSTLEIIVELNRGLLADLKSRLSQWPSVQKFGDLFIRMAPILRLYSGYVRNFDLAQKTVLTRRESNSAFVEFLAEKEKNCGGLQLESYLIMPVQRLPRYQMLLQGLLKYTDEKHVDFEDLMMAQENIVEICKEINFQKQVDENMRVLKNLIDEVDGLAEVLGDFGFFIHRGNLHSIKGVNIDSFHYILFSDLLVKCGPSKSKKSWTVVEAFPLYKVVSAIDIPDMAGIKNCVEICGTVMKGDAFVLEKPFKMGLCAGTASEKSLWIKRIKNFNEMWSGEEGLRFLEESMNMFKDSLGIGGGSQSLASSQSKVFANRLAAMKRTMSEFL